MFTQSIDQTPNAPASGPRRPFEIKRDPSLDKPEKIGYYWGMANEAKNEAHYATAREIKTNGRRATCTPWCGHRGLPGNIRLYNDERKTANRAMRRRAKQALRNER